MKKIIKRTRKWTTKSGELRVREYIYEVSSETRLTKAGKKTKKTLSEKYLEAIVFLFFDT